MNQLPQKRSNKLHITSDILTAEHLDKSLPEGVFLAWQDALYEGPISAESNLTHLSRHRAKYFVEAGWGDNETIEERYQKVEVCCYRRER